jgi:hypothetical protein
MWRQGDILFAAVDAVPPKATRLPHCVLAEGEMTGHRHSVEESGVAELYLFEGNHYLRVIADAATVVHQEHRPITLLTGVYRVWPQREYSPQEFRRVMD